MATISYSYELYNLQSTQHPSCLVSLSYILSWIDIHNRGNRVLFCWRNHSESGKEKEKDREESTKKVFMKLAYASFYPVCTEESTKKVSQVLKNNKIDIYSMILLEVTTHTRESY